MTTAQLAKLLGRSVAQLSADRDAGRGPRFTVLDGVVHYRLGDLRAFLNAPAA
ncbi:DNA-binding protein [Burkholderia gladioli]|uniref:DNA-binding protein n=1 Tax=Burkholderia gladioli TaxID=28095 RepID=UPI001641CA2D|nr:DNA-binding protein [Burkholderia gladioli]